MPTISHPLSFRQTQSLFFCTCTPGWGLTQETVLGIWPKKRGVSTMRALLTECELLFMQEHTQLCQHTHANTHKHANTHTDTHINTLPPQLLSLDRFSDLEDPESPSAQWRVALCFHWNSSLHFSNRVSCAASKHVLTIYGDRREAHTAEQCIYFSLPHWIVLPVCHLVASADANVERGQETAEWHHLQDILKIPELPKHLLYYDEKLYEWTLCARNLRST